MMKNRDLQSLLAGLFPEDLAVVASITCPPEATLLPPEEAHTGSMVDKRLREFTHGRHCARQAMLTLGLPMAAIIKKSDRSPQWPEGMSGTISHTGDIAAAVIGHAADYRSLGLDIEDAAPLDEASRDLILRPEERDGDGVRAKLLFSIKEAIYKCLYPVVNGYIDFQEMAVEIDEAAGRYIAQPHTNLVSAELAAQLEGRYRVTPELVIATAWIRSGPNTEG